MPSEEECLERWRWKSEGEVSGEDYARSASDSTSWSGGSYKVTIRLEFLSEPRNEWCDRCCLPALETIDTVMLLNDVPSCVGAYSRCASGCDDGEVTMEGQV